MGSTHKGTWKNFEREVARTDFDSERNPLSGANSRQDDGSPRGGDVIIPLDLSVLVECKYRASHAHHSLHRDVALDAAKHKKKHALLYTKVKQERGWLVTIDGALWSQIVRLPEVRKLLRA